MNLNLKTLEVFQNYVRAKAKGYRVQATAMGNVSVWEWRVEYFF